MTKLTLMAALILTAWLMATGCKSTHEEGVSSNVRKQWTDVDANTMTTTAAAKSVLEGEHLKMVEAKSTAVDGMAMGQMADGTKVHVDVAKKTDTTSHISVVVGTMGDAKIGAEIAKKIKLKAEAK